MVGALTGRATGQKPTRDRTVRVSRVHSSGMADPFVREDCGTAFEAEPDAFPATCPDCDARVHPQAGHCDYPVCG